MEDLVQAVSQAAEDLREKGWAVVPAVLTELECDQTIGAIWEWLQKLNPAIDPSDPATWKMRDGHHQWPIGVHGGIAHYEVAHQRFAWAIRKNARVRRVWELLLGDNDLLTSFDGICVMKASKQPPQQASPWLHVDQGRRRRGFHCIQGLANLTEVGLDGGTLLVREGSHRLHEQLMQSVTSPDDYVKFTDEQLAILRDCPERRVDGPKGSLFLWDSRTAHQNVNASAAGLPRYVIYCCYQPRILASEGDLRKKRDAWDNYRVTTHWPAKRVKLVGTTPRHYGNPFQHPLLGTIRTRDQLDDQVVMRQMAGVEFLAPAARVVSTPLLTEASTTGATV